MNKLVRDNIPNLIKDSGKKPIFYKLDDSKLTEFLFHKLTEEVDELRQNLVSEEIADVAEVLFALAKRIGYSEEDILQEVYKKRNERGGFEEGFVLIEVID